MITIITGSNRLKSNSLIIANEYAKILKNRGFESLVFTMSHLAPDFAYTNMEGEKQPKFMNIVHKFISLAEKSIFIVPEYNGSFPGLLKTFIDCVPPKLWFGKKCSMIGISLGHVGNLLGLSHLTAIMHYLQVEVMSKKSKFAYIDNLLDNPESIPDAQTLAKLDEHITMLLNF